jgi:oligoendopeptidase F
MFYHTLVACDDAEGCVSSQILKRFQEADRKLEQAVKPLYYSLCKQDEGEVRELAGIVPHVALHLARIRNECKFIPGWKIEATLREKEQVKEFLKRKEVLLARFRDLTARLEAPPGLPWPKGVHRGDGDLKKLRKATEAHVRRWAWEATMKRLEMISGELCSIFREATGTGRLEGSRMSLATELKRDLISEKAMESLMAACRAEAPGLYSRYLPKKENLMGLAKMSFCDIYLPIVEFRLRKIPFEEALHEVIAAFMSFSPAMADLASSVHGQGRLSTRPIKGPGSKNFCITASPGETPWVRLQYRGNLPDVFCLAHELGHATHEILASRNSCLQYWATPPMAEVGSMFGEALLARHLASKAPESVRRMAMLWHLNRTLDFSCDLIFITSFEEEAQKLSLRGAAPHEYASLHLAHLGDLYGDSLEIPNEYSWGFLLNNFILEQPFGLYRYAFGQLVALSLMSLWDREGHSAVDRITGILSAGGNGSPEEILAAHGVGPLDEGFWKGGFEFISRMVDEL